MRYFSTLVLLIIFLNTSFGQDSSKVNSYELKHGIQFQIRSLSLTSFNSYTFAFRYLLDKNSGLRVGLHSRLKNEDSDAIQQIDTLKFDVPYSHEYSNIKFSIQYLHTKMRFEDFSLFVGGGPFFTYHSNESSNEYPTQSYTNKRKDSEKGYGFGIDFLVGVEYKLYKNIILSGEYSLGISKDNTEFEIMKSTIYKDGRPNIIVETIGEKNIIKLKETRVNLGISIFF